METIGNALFLSVIANRVIEAFVAPISKKWPGLDLWWLIYVSWAVGGAIGWIANINLFEAYLPDVLVGRVMTAVVIGGGSNLLADLFPDSRQPRG